MRWFLLYLAERLARDPALRTRFHAALDALRRSGCRRASGDRVIDHADPGLSRTAPPPGLGDGTRARSLIWMLGSGLPLLWGAADRRRLRTLGGVRRLGHHTGERH